MLGWRCRPLGSFAATPNPCARLGPLRKRPTQAILNFAKILGNRGALQLCLRGQSEARNTFPTALTH